MNKLDTVRCVDCDRFDLRGSGMARQGFGLCSRKARWENVSATFPRQCKDFAAAATEKAAARREWLINGRTKP